MRLRSVYSGVTREEVFDLMGFAPVMPESLRSRRRRARKISTPSASGSTRAACC
jgi:hypothetical protein